LNRFIDEVRNARPDCLVFTGDTTGLGFENELNNAFTVLSAVIEDGIPGVAVPGNHDYYTPAVAASGLFERYWRLWQEGKRVDDAVYPFARRIGPLWLVAVNSSTGNRAFWDAAGSVGREQLDRLQRLLPTLDSGLRILVTHYPVCLSSGAPERRFRSLRDLDDLLRIAKQGKVSIWLHGHRHTPYYFERSARAAFPIICAGSATSDGSGSYGDYTITGNKLAAVRRQFSPAEGSFMEVERFELELPKFD
jgi:3',5'-cyclic AMP phosphodiesterase CpdA